MVRGRAQPRIPGGGSTQPQFGESVAAHGHPGATRDGKSLRPAAIARSGSLSRPGDVRGGREGLPGDGGRCGETAERVRADGKGDRCAAAIARARVAARATAGWTGGGRRARATGPVGRPVGFAWPGPGALPQYARRHEGFSEAHRPPRPVGGRHRDRALAGSRLDGVRGGCRRRAVGGSPGFQERPAGGLVGPNGSSNWRRRKCC